MKTIALTLFAAALGIAQNQSTTSSTPAGATPTPKAAAPASSKAPSKAPDKKTPQAQSIPAGATQVEPYLYRYTDSGGKTWMYRQTPFGISKWEEASTPAPQSVADKSEPVAVTDLGDSVRFQKKTPFGLGTWVRKKSELNDEEKALLAADKAKEEK